MSHGENFHLTFWLTNHVSDVDQMLCVVDGQALNGDDYRGAT